MSAGDTVAVQDLGLGFRVQVPRRVCRVSSVCIKARNLAEARTVLGVDG